MVRSRVLVVGTLNNGVNRTGFLAESTEDALGHVNVILSGSSSSVISRLSLDSDSVSGASGFTELTSDTSLLSGRVSSKSMLTSEVRRKRSLLPRVMDDVIRLESRPDGEEGNSPDHLGFEERIIDVLRDVSDVEFVRDVISSCNSNVLLVILSLRFERVRVVIL